MHRLRCPVTVLVLVSALACSGDRSPESGPGKRQKEATRTFADAKTLGRIEEPRLIETSGIVASRTEARTYWAHNDSGGAPELFCLRAGGDSCGTVTVVGAELVDWEDIAAGPEGDLYIGDIGDNTRSRDSVVVYRLPEPVPPGAGNAGESEPVEVLRFTYPRSRSFDAETLAVDPGSGAIYIVTKDSPALVFRGRRDGGPLRVVGALRLPGLLSFPTGGDISVDGRHVIVTTYDRAFEYALDEGQPFDAIWKGTPVEVTLPLARQREAIAYRRDGRAIITTSEGRKAPLFERRVVTD